MFERQKFFVEDTCIGCELCKMNCVNHAIEIQSQKPIWVKKDIQCVYLVYIIVLNLRFNMENIQKNTGNLTTNKKA